MVVEDGLKDLIVGEEVPDVVEDLGHRQPVQNIHDQRSGGDRMGR